MTPKSGNGHNPAGPGFMNIKNIDDIFPQGKATNIGGKLVRRADLDLVSQLKTPQIVMTPEQLQKNIAQAKPNVIASLYAGFGSRCAQDQKLRLIPLVIEVPTLEHILEMRILVWEFVPDDPEQVVGLWKPPEAPDQATKTPETPPGD